MMDANDMKKYVETLIKCTNDGSYTGMGITIPFDLKYEAEGIESKEYLDLVNRLDEIHNKFNRSMNEHYLMAAYINILPNMCGSTTSNNIKEYFDSLPQIVSVLLQVILNNVMSYLDEYISYTNDSESNNKLFLLVYTRLRLNCYTYIGILGGATEIIYPTYISLDENKSREELVFRQFTTDISILYDKLSKELKESEKFKDDTIKHSGYLTEILKSYKGSYDLFITANLDIHIEGSFACASPPYITSFSKYLHHILNRILSCGDTDLMIAVLYNYFNENLLFDKENIVSEDLFLLSCLRSKITRILTSKSLMHLIHPIKLRRVNND